MALQFILGSARSGKTNFIYDQMIKDSIEHENEEFFFIVPDQSTLNAQKQLVTRHKRHGTFNIDVVGFFRLTYRVFEELSYIPKDLLEDEGKSMVIRKIMQQHKDELKVFASSMKKQGFIDEMKSFFAEIYQYDISMEDLEKITDSMQEEGLKSKMEDILLVMKKFEEYIKDRYLISEQLLDVLAEKIEQSKKLQNATFYFDGFTGFTPIQRKVLEKILKIGKNVYISLTLDGRSVRTKYREYELFAMSKKEKRELITLAEKAGTQVLPDIICWPDQRDSKELRHLEQNIERYPYETYQGEIEDIKVQCFMNPRTEARMIANEIERLVRTEGYRYKDLVVLTADLENYQNELEKSFEDLHIPYFIDVNRKLLNNPCIETILSALKMIQKDFSYDMVFRYLKSGFSNFTMEEADFLENYVLACGIRGFARWNRPFASKLFSEEDVLRAEELRGRFIEEIGALKSGLKRRGSTVKRKLVCLYEFLETLDVEGKMLKKQEMFEEMGDLLQARTYAKVYDQVIDLLEQMYEILGEEKLSYDDFLSVLESGLEEMQIGVIPPSLDQVVVGDMKRTRTEEVKILFFLGINEGVIPAANDGGGVVNDHQREVLGNYGIDLVPGAKQSAYMEQFYLYLTVSKPTDKLYLSYCMMDAAGNNHRPSYFIERILQIFPKLKVEMQEEDPHTGYTKEEALDHMITCLQEIDLAGNETKEQDEQMVWMQTLYHALKEIKPVTQYIDAKFYTNEALPLSKELIHELYGDTISGSVTRMEKFAGCAFSHFIQYGLRLRKRLVHEILPTDMGKVFHKTMELVGKRSDWKFADDESRDAFVETMVENAVTEVQKELFESNHRNEYMLERMKRISKRAVWAMEQHIKRGDFTPEEYEVAFGEQDHLDSMTFLLEDGEKMIFTGVVDRMDSMEDEENKYLKIIDYKSGNQKFDFAKIFHGLQMQLIIYMNAMIELYQKKSGKRVYPAGMFYFHLDDPIVDVKYEDEYEAKKELLKKLKMKGVVNEDFQLINQMEHTGSEGFLTLPVRATKTGYDKRSSILNTTQLMNLGRFVEKKITELGNSMMHGDISIKPYEYDGKKLCDYCEFKNICAYEEGVDKVEKIKKVSLEEGKHALDSATAESHRSKKC